jgi:hypothetical protein
MPHAYQRALDEVLDSSAIKAHIQSALQGRLGNQFSPLAYLHPNGFLKIRVLTAESGQWSLRLHIWEPGLTDSDIHTHRWDFASRIITGEVQESLYEPILGEGPHQAYSCSRSQPGSMYVFEPLEKCDLDEISQELHSAGKSYTRNHVSFHGVTPTSERLTVTAVLQGPPIEPNTTVIVPRSAQVVSEERFKTVEQSSIRRILRDVTDLI